MAQELRVHQTDPQQMGQRNAQLQRNHSMPVLPAFDELDRLFDELLPGSMFRLGRSPIARSLMQAQARTPKVDLIEQDNEVLLRAEVPGLSKDDLDVSIDEGSVTIRGTISHDGNNAEGDYYRREITRGEFVRAVALPSVVDTEKARASLKDGVLELVMPKLEVAKRRKIQIS